MMNSPEDVSNDDIRHHEVSDVDFNAVIDKYSAILDSLQDELNSQGTTIHE